MSSQAYRTSQRVSGVLFSLALVGCMTSTPSLDVTNYPQYESLIGSCWETQKPLLVLENRCEHLGQQNVLMKNIEVFRTVQDRCLGPLVIDVPSGSTLSIERIIERVDEPRFGDTEICLVVETTLSDFGLPASIANSCGRRHHSLFAHFRNYSGQPIRLDSDYLVACSKSSE